MNPVTSTRAGPLSRTAGSCRWVPAPTVPTRRGPVRADAGDPARLIDHRNGFSIHTKGTLIPRDLDLLTQACRSMEVATAFSIGTVDEDVWRRSEPGTPHPRKRLEAVAALNAAGVPCGVLVAPILPGISDHPRQLREVVEAAIDAGATHVAPILLHLRPGVREEFLPWLEQHYPDLVPRYERTYVRSYAPAADRAALGRTVAAIERQLRHRHSVEPTPRWSRPKAEPKHPEPTQLTLV